MTLPSPGWLALIAVSGSPWLALGAAAFLNEVEIQQIAPCKFTGTYYEAGATISSGEWIAGQMTRGGSFFMAWNGGRWPTGRFDKARWWTEGGSWCRQFTDLSEGKPVCYSVRREGLEYVFINSQGSKAFAILCDPFTS